MTGNSSASGSEVLAGSTVAEASEQDTASSYEDKEQELGAAEPWNKMRRRGRCQRSREISDPTSSTSNYTVILKSICRENVFNIATKNTKDAITRTSVNDKECTVRVNEKWNTIANTIPAIRGG